MTSAESVALRPECLLPDSTTRRSSRSSSPFLQSAGVAWPWFGRDVTSLGAANASTLPSSAASARRHVGPLFAGMAADVAARSFNGKELILVGSNADGLPLALNLLANLAQLNLHHAFMLADKPNTCQMLTHVSRPACVSSGLARQHGTRRARYGVHEVRLTTPPHYTLSLHPCTTLEGVTGKTAFSPVRPHIFASVECLALYFNRTHNTQNILLKKGDFECRESC